MYYRIKRGPKYFCVIQYILIVMFAIEMSHCFCRYEGRVNSPCQCLIKQDTQFFQQTDRKGKTKLTRGPITSISVCGTSPLLFKSKRYKQKEHQAPYPRKKTESDIMLLCHFVFLKRGKCLYHSKALNHMHTINSFRSPYGVQIYGYFNKYNSKRLAFYGAQLIFFLFFLHLCSKVTTVLEKRPITVPTK